MKMKWNKKNLERDKENESEEFYKQLQESEEELKSDSQNNHWLKRDDDDDEDIIDYVWESISEIKKPDDDEKN